MRILFPMTANILTPGHIKCLNYLSSKGHVFVSLLSRKGLKGYKTEIVPYEDRRFIIQSLNIPNLIVVKQDSLDPSENIKKFKCEAIASGDGWEQVEKDIIKDMSLTEINIKLDNEGVGKKYSSSSIINKIKNLKP